EDRVMCNSSQGKKQEVEDQSTNVKLSKNKTSVTACNDSLNAKTLNVKSVSAICDKCVLIDKHAMCVLNSVAKPIKRTVALESNQKPRNFTRKLYERVSKTCSWWYSKFTPSGYKWKPKYGKENMPIRVLLLSTNERKEIAHVGWGKTTWGGRVEAMGTVPVCVCAQEIWGEGTGVLVGKTGKGTIWFVIVLGFRKIRSLGFTNVCKLGLGVPLCQILHCLLILLQLVEIVLFIVDSGCSKHMAGNLKLLINFVEKFLGTVKFRNDQIVPILGYGDLVQGAITIKRVYYVEGLTHNLFSVGQFCDANLEVAFRKSTCFIRNLKGNDLLLGSRRTDLYSITLQDTNSPNLICLQAKATSSQAWLWHHRLSHLNFDTINLLSKNDIVVGLPKVKFVKDHLCSSCELWKTKQKSFHTKLTPSSKRRLQLLHMDLCGPMRVASINGKRYVLVIVDDYSRYTWTYFLRSKDETPEVLVTF
nr:retrovirus-related Pol polyprotein from transposon TNT 1-94 [Tanacetum cinerariifolium]